MDTTASANDSRYARCIEASKRIRWDIDRDVIRGRTFDLGHKFLPDGLSLVDTLDFLDPAEQRLLSQIQGRTYANMFGLIERYIGVKMLEICHGYGMGDQTALEALLRFTDEELKHQALFRRIELLTAAQMPAGYRFTAQPNDVAGFVLGKSSWAVLALTCDVELFTQAHYRASIGAAPELSDLYKDVFLFHWKEESQHAILDELEWLREDARISPEERDAGVDDLIALVAGVDGILQGQAAADAAYFLQVTTEADMARGARLQVRADETLALVLKAYRWQYIVSGVQGARFQQLLGELITPAQLARIQAALAGLMYAVPEASAPHPEGEAPALRAA